MKYKELISIINTTKQDGSFSSVYINQVNKYIYTKIVYFPTWNMFFLYKNGKFICETRDCIYLLSLLN